MWYLQRKCSDLFTERRQLNMRNSCQFGCKAAKRPANTMSESNPSPRNSVKSGGDSLKGPTLHFALHKRVTPIAFQPLQSFPLCCAPNDILAAPETPHTKLIFLWGSSFLKAGIDIQTPYGRLSLLLTIGLQFTT